MKVTYESVTGEVTEVDIDDSIGAVLIASRRREDADDKKEHRHCISLDAITYEGLEFGTADFSEELSEKEDELERVRRINNAFSHLTELQQKRLLLLAGGMSIREIARREGKDFSSVKESIHAAKKKFLKFYK